jgi:diguanylate cyclase (GGDEF)-like protein
VASGPRIRLRDLFGLPIFGGDAKTAGAANNHVLAWVLLGLVAPGMIVLAIAVPSMGTLVWTATAGVVFLATMMLVVTRLGHVTEAAAVFLVGIWALFAWAAWMSGGLFSAVICAQFLLVALAEATRGWRWALPASVLAIATVVAFTWADVERLARPSSVITTPTSYGAVVVACLIALAVTNGLIVARTRLAGDQVAAELQERKAAEQRLRDLIDNAPFGAFLCELVDRRCLRVTHANRNASVVLGKDASQFVGGDLGDAFAASASHDLLDRFRRLALRGETLGADEIQMHSGGAERTFEVHAYQTEPGVIAVFFSDVTERRVDEARIRQLAFHDELTKLPNRKLLLDRLGVAIDVARRRESGVALLFIDLDEFKPLNDRHGHAFGDLVLSEVAGRLRATARASDTVARIGGDEFTVLMPDVSSREQAETVAGKLVEAFRKPLEVGGRMIKITASIGVAVTTDHDVDPDMLVEYADRAMYEVKRGGRDGYRVK